MRESIRNFNRQFEFVPHVENVDGLNGFDRFVVAGMGGSHLAADLIKIWNPKIDLTIHKSYGLPRLPNEVLRKSLVIASSYSGNTEETIDAFNTAVNEELPVLCISTGGKLIELAKERNAPHILLPDTGLQPRMAVGYSFLAFLKAMKEDTAVNAVSRLVNTLNPLEFEEMGAKFADRLKGCVPIIYSSAENEALANNWKIKFNETSKIPAFYNTFPELNHNEMTSFDVIESTRALSDKFYFLLLRDSKDDARIQKRMDVLSVLYKERGLYVEDIEIGNDDVFYKIFSCLVLADWTAYRVAEKYGVESEQVPMVEKFKKLI